MKRLRIKLIEEFKEADKFRLRGVKFRYDDLRSVWLSWSMYGGRYVSLRHDLSKTVKEYKKDYTDVPVPILKASIRYFKERERLSRVERRKSRGKQLTKCYEKIEEKIGKKNS